MNFQSLPPLNPFLSVVPLLLSLSPPSSPLSPFRVSVECYNVIGALYVKLHGIKRTCKVVANLYSQKQIVKSNGQL